MRSIGDSAADMLASIFLLTAVVMGIAIGVLILTVIAGLVWLGYMAYRQWQKRHDPPGGSNAWSNTGDWTGFSILHESMPLGGRNPWR